VTVFWNIAPSAQNNWSMGVRVYVCDLSVCVCVSVMCVFVVV